MTPCVWPLSRLAPPPLPPEMTSRPRSSRPPEPSLLHFLHNRIQGQVGRIAIYVDEVALGNNLRPDHARAFYAWFWSFLEWPHWYRSRQFGWFDLCVMKAKDVHAIPGGVSALAVHILKMFWDPTGLMHMENLGVRVAGPRGPWILRAKFAVWLMDERAEKFLTSCKGSSGSKPCISCRNCVGRIDPADVSEGFMHFSKPPPARRFSVSVTSEGIPFLIFLR